MPEQPEREDRKALVDRVAEAAARGGLRIAVAESLTSGHLAAALGAGAHAADWFAGGVVAYQMDTKADVLGVRRDADPCSAECATSLAAGVRALLRADVAVSATGVGGPEPEDDHAPGTVYIGWATAEETGGGRYDFPGDPEDVIDQTVGSAVRLLLGVVAARIPAAADPRAMSFPEEG